MFTGFMFKKEDSIPYYILPTNLISWSKKENVKQAYRSSEYKTRHFHKTYLLYVNIKYKHTKVAQYHFQPLA